MKRLAATLISAALAALLPAALAATITCTPSGDNPITVTVVSTGAVLEGGREVTTNATVSFDSCDGVLVPPSPTCTWSATIDSPGPGSVEITIRDTSGLQTCGPFTNDDGLPVELIEFSVD